MDLDRNGQEIGKLFIARMEAVFEQELLNAGISQYVLEGDGIKGALPGEMTLENLARVCHMFEQIHDNIP